ncbi:P1 family peptidase [Steroidobacter sp.]|uniref:P1 family peptidase n=1 Tax=Steroidobacter sp. TaxID=1978227 RepID=UPI001A454139|nr:P1 family peptidase [Steroidobacter sp.]MBL8271319.1 P1 family peptidase [Steroidobacter sp.]
MHGHALKLSQLCCVLVTLAAVAPVLAAAPPSQAHLEPVLNAGINEPSALRFDWPMLRIGTGEYAEGPTGVTVIRFARPVSGAIDARGGGPGTVNPEFLQLGYDRPALDAIVFSGGSWYGLETVTAVNTAFVDEGYRGGRWDNVGLVEGSIVYDLGSRRLNEIYPDKKLAQAALRAVQPGVYPVGPYGAGRLVMTGAVFGCNTHSGQGGAFRQVGDLKIAAFTVVNAFGIVTDRDGRVPACNRAPDWPAHLQAPELKAKDLMAEALTTRKEGWPPPPAPNDARRNTTISLVVVNQALAPWELQRLAVQVHTSMGRAIQPFATEYDGDVLYAVSTAELTPPEDQRISLVNLGLLAGEVMWDAVLSAAPQQPAMPVPVATAVADAKTLNKYVGDYTFSQFATLTVTAADGKLFGRATGERDIYAIKTGAAVELVPVNATDFTVPGRYPLLLRFDGKGVLTVNPGRWQQVTNKSRR